MSTVPGWEGILDEDEHIMWQGRPDTRIAFRWANTFMVVFGLFFSGFALFWMIMAAQAGGAFWMFGLLHFGVGMSMVVGAIYADAWRRRHTWYTLTDKRAFVATDIPFKGKKLEDYDINASMRIHFVEGPPDSIHFTTRKGANNTRRPTGFDRINDGKEVYRIMRDIQRTAPD